MKAGSRSIFVCAAHPDDEVLGCGATIARHIDEGDVVNVLIIAQGIFSRSDGSASGEALDSLRACARRANERLGVSSLEILDYPDNRLDTVSRLDLAKVVEERLDRYRASIVYTHYPNDLNVDHCRVSEAVTIASRPVPGSTVTALRFFEVQSSTEWRPPSDGSAFAPTFFVDVSATLERKVSALQEYDGEMRPWPHARSIQAIEHLARWRGSTVGMEAAEAFVIGRELMQKQGERA